MPPRTRLSTLLAVAVLALPALASAQNAAPSGPTTAQPQTQQQAQQQSQTQQQTQQQTLRRLRQQARRLTLIAQLPQADRAPATELLDRAAALRQRALDLRIREMQAYVAALQAGTAPNAARIQAQQQVSDQRLALANDMDALRSDAQAFLQKVPEARALLRGLPGGPAAASGPAQGRRPGLGSGRWPGDAAPGTGRMPGATMPWGGRPGSPR